MASSLLDRFFNKVEFIFYLRGHTKNVCDRLFNLLKLRYHKSNVYTMEILVEVLNMMDDITFTHAPSDVFYNFDKMLDIFYKNFKPGTIQKNHYFVVDSSEPTTMLSKLFIDDTSTNSYNHHKAVKERDLTYPITLWRDLMHQESEKSSKLNCGKTGVNLCDIHTNRSFVPSHLKI